MTEYRDTEHIVTHRIEVTTTIIVLLIGVAMGFAMGAEAMLHYDVAPLTSTIREQAGFIEQLNERLRKANSSSPLHNAIIDACPCLETLPGDVYVDGSNETGCADDGNDCKSRVCGRDGVGPCKTIRAATQRFPHATIDVISSTKVDP